MSAQNLTFHNKPVPYNYTLWYTPTLCTLDTCPKSYATVKYVPSAGGNASLLAWFALIFVVQLMLGIQKRAWTFLAAMLGGCILEMIGYAARVSMYYNIFDFNRFLMYVLRPLILFVLCPCCLLWPAISLLSSLLATLATSSA